MARPTADLIPVVGLTVDATFGIAGTFVSSDAARQVVWLIDGVGVIAATALLAVRFLRRGDDTVAAGFLVFLAGETLIVSGSAMELAASAPSFAAGAGLWSAALVLISASPVMPSIVRVTGTIASVLFAVTVVRILLGGGLTPLSQPLPFYAYPFLAITLFGWAWAHLRS